MNWERQRTYDIDYGKQQGIQEKAVDATIELLKENIAPEIIAKCEKLPLEKVLEKGLPPHICLNVNFPKVPVKEIKGIRITRQCHATWHEDLQERTDPYGRKYYWLTGWLERLEQEDDTCEWALQHNYVSIQPVAEA